LIKKRASHPNHEYHPTWHSCQRLGVSGLFAQIVLEIKVHIEANIDISFGLAFLLSVSAVYFNAMEVKMKNSIAYMACFMASVWCGAAFLRRPVW
jgi:hypothetical protein